MTETEKPSKPIDKLSFEEALRELEIIVRGMESGNVELERALADYTRGAALQAHCAQKLAEAKMKIEQITQAADGSLTITPTQVA